MDRADLFRNNNNNLSGLASVANAFNGSNVRNASFWEALKNKFTGNLDYQRNLALQQQAQAFNAEEAAKQREFEERLANTAYQRQVADLKAAGYNPALALGAGGASTPTGYAASSGAAHYTDNTRGFEFLANALIAGVGLGVKASLSASQIAYNQIKGATLGAGSASQIALNSMKAQELASKSSLNSVRGKELLARAGYHQAHGDYYSWLIGDRQSGEYRKAREELAAFAKFIGIHGNGAYKK